MVEAVAIHVTAGTTQTWFVVTETAQTWFVVAGTAQAWFGVAGTAQAWFIVAGTAAAGSGGRRQEPLVKEPREAHIASVEMPQQEAQRLA